MFNQKFQKNEKYCHKLESRARHVFDMLNPIEQAISVYKLEIDASKNYHTQSQSFDSIIQLDNRLLIVTWTPLRTMSTEAKPRPMIKWSKCALVLNQPKSSGFSSWFKRFSLLVTLQRFFEWINPF